MDLSVQAVAWILKKVGQDTILNEISAFIEHAQDTPEHSSSPCLNNLEAKLETPEPLKPLSLNPPPPPNGQFSSPRLPNSHIFRALISRIRFLEKGP